MNEFLKIFLPLYFIIYFGFTFFLKSIFVAKKIGKNPIVLPKDDSAYGLIGYYFKILIILIFVYLISFYFFPINYITLIIKFDIIIVKYIGLFFLLFSIFWTIIAQYHMGNSWRIGIDTESKSNLITIGVFKHSRNPIFFGIIVNLIGFFLIIPNIFTLMFLLLGYILIQIQIRLEEDFLLKQHGVEYLIYKQKVRRFI